MTPTEAAEIVMCTPVAMRSRLFEARRELEALFERDLSRGAGNRPPRSEGGRP